MTITLDRHKANATNVVTNQLLHVVFRRLRMVSELRVAIITGSGRVFRRMGPERRGRRRAYRHQLWARQADDCSSQCAGHGWRVRTAQIVAAAPLPLAALKQVLRATETQTLEQAYRTLRGCSLPAYTTMLQSVGAT